MAVVYQIFVNQLNGRSLCLQIDGPQLSIQTLKQSIYQKTLIPPSIQRLVSGTREFTDNCSVISDAASRLFPSVNLLLRLRGGKGGFGSLLRGAASKAGAKKTNNFDACRDMSGRRLRHVNAEKKLEEWMAEAEERKLEKIAEEFLKKKMKEVGKKKGGKDGKKGKYVEKYKEDTVKVIDDVRRAVQESIANGFKRKGKEVKGGQGSKRLKLWEIEEDSDDEDADEKSVILDEGVANRGQSAPLTISKSPDSGAGSSGVDSKEAGCSADDHSKDSSGHDSNETELSPPSIENGVCRVAGTAIASQSKDCPLAVENGASVLDSSETPEETPERRTSDGTLAQCNNETLKENVPSCHSELTEPQELGLGCKDQCRSNSHDILDFEAFDSPKDMEVLGMERLKTELQARGLKCGGTLEQRAERLFLLKSTPVEMIPKKHFAKAK